MFYNSTLVLVGGSDCTKIHEYYPQLIYNSLYRTVNGGCLDILVLRSQNTIRAVERLTAAFYDLARQQINQMGKRDIRVTVLLDGRNLELNRKQSWEVIIAGKYEDDLLSDFRNSLPENCRILGLPTVIVKMPNNYSTQDPGNRYSSSNRRPSYAGANGPAYSLNGIVEEDEDVNMSDLNRLKSDEDELTKRTKGKDSAGEWEHDVVAVGGTFDHLHDGHRLLLTVAGYLAKEKLIAGITGSELLVNKKYAEVLESYLVRRSHVEEFLAYVFPQLEVETIMLHDPAGPTVLVENIDALVVSRETFKGGLQINKTRLDKGWKPLIVYDIGMLGCVEGNEQNNYMDKLSSTDIRRLEFERLHISDQRIQI
ncbi:uncharacterized protein SAPINGB_P004995 [Magnusiomyces paraingens]|uniref:Cytidyltransferase-like domain-containing protein n=1 Tax=Magnusiomyces paraingens TaxID=2606893 RepID=A0A5E8C304_9ASCO|nr:uncharacterized protein SAPINGB_P004995 [Saprochaete ingens]VVT56351.1 unnamed protein product [Saprochaete ingens]